MQRCEGFWSKTNIWWGNVPSSKQTSSASSSRCLPACCESYQLHALVARYQIQHHFWSSNPLQSQPLFDLHSLRAAVLTGVALIDNTKINRAFPLTATEELTTGTMANERVFKLKSSSTDSDGNGEGIIHVPSKLAETRHVSIETRKQLFLKGPLGSVMGLHRCFVHRGRRWFLWLISKRYVGLNRPDLETPHTEAFPLTSSFSLSGLQEGWNQWVRWM